MIEEIKKLDHRLNYIDKLFKGELKDRHTNHVYEKSIFYSKVELGFDCWGYQGKVCTGAKEVNDELVRLLIDSKIGDELINIAVENAKKKIAKERNNLSDKLKEMMTHISIENDYE